MTKLASIRERLREAKESAGFAWEDMTPGRRRLLMAGAIGLVALVGVGVYLLTRSSDRSPKLDDPVAVAHYLTTAEFKALPGEQKRPYMKATRKQMPQIESACREKRIDRQTYRTAYVFARLERRLDDMEDYYKQPANKRQALLDKMLAGEATPHAPATKPKDPAPPPPPHASPQHGDSLLYTSEEERQRFEAMKDDLEDDFFDSWLPGRKQQWKDFRAAYTGRRKQLESSASAAPGRGG